MKVPRYIGVSDGCKYVLCGFCDASNKGYAAVAYLRVTDPLLTVSVYFLGAETKLAPMKVSPSPELCGAVLLASWLLRMKRISDTRLHIVDVYAWSDSTIVLSWLSYPQTHSERSFQIVFMRLFRSFQIAIGHMSA